MIHSPLTATTDITEWQVPDSLTVRLTDVFCTLESGDSLVHATRLALVMLQVLTVLIDSWHNRS